MYTNKARGEIEKLSHAVSSLKALNKNRFKMS